MSTSKLEPFRISRFGGWRSLPDHAWLFTGKIFSDARGDSWEAFDLSGPNRPFTFCALQENIISTAQAGCARGLHYQVGLAAQAKLVSVVQGSAQFFWVPLTSPAARPEVNSITLPAEGTSLYTAADCAHGFLSLEDNTVFALRMSKPVQPSKRGEVNILSPQLSLAPARYIRPESLSDRDRMAPEWHARRRG